MEKVDVTCTPVVPGSTNRVIADDPRISYVDHQPEDGMVKRSDIPFSSLGRTPVQVACKKCKYMITTCVTFEPGPKSWLWGFVFLLFLPCGICGLCCNCSLTALHSCPKCGALLDVVPPCS